MSEFEKKHHHHHDKEKHKHKRKESPKRALREKVESLRHLAKEEYREAVRDALEHHETKREARHIYRKELHAIGIMEKEDYAGGI